jgi:hypothetical protein
VKVAILSSDVLKYDAGSLIAWRSDSLPSNLN